MQIIRGICKEFIEYKNYMITQKKLEFGFNPLAPCSLFFLLLIFLDEKLDHDKLTMEL